MEMIKKVLYAGIGLAEETKSKFSEEFNDLVEKGKEVKKIKKSWESVGVSRII